MDKKKTPLTAEHLEKSLNQQTKTILNAVDEKLETNRINILADVDKKFETNRINILADVDEKILASEERINRKLDRLTTTLDKFLKRMTDLEDEFAIMKHDINRLKKIIKEKLGVDVS